MTPPNPLRQLPSVDELLLTLKDQLAAFPRRLVVEECRATLAEARQRLKAGQTLPQELSRTVRERLLRLSHPPLLHVINATGVILHTNLGRAPLPAFPVPSAYTNLEYDLPSGKRGKRDAHTAALLERLLGRPAIAVNNGAAAVWLVLHELAAGGEVLISRGEMIEIGDGFRIPEIMERSGARLVEVGTTNKTRVDDYARACTPNTRLILRVHPSNFRMEGFTGRPSLSELAALAKDKGIPLYEDLGSGCLWEHPVAGIQEPSTTQSFEAGVDLISFSGDKLLGGPQAGIIAGREDLVQRVRRNPMFRAFRMDKLGVACLSETLRLLVLERWDQIPAWRMLRMTLEEVRVRAEGLLERLGRSDVMLMPGESLIGGGSTPQQSLPTWLLAVSGDAVAIERQLRLGEPPVLGRIEGDRLLLDLRTVLPEEEADLLRALRRL